MSRELGGVAGGIAAQVAELIHGAKGGALVCACLALNAQQEPGGAAPVSFGEHIVGVGAAAVDDHTLYHFDFHALGAGDEPLGLGDLLDEEAFVGGGGGEFGEVDFE